MYFLAAPDVVIYDFACGLHNCCLNREAKFFQHTKFLIDRYHQPNHKGIFLLFKVAHSYLLGAERKKITGMRRYIIRQC